MAWKDWSYVKKGALIGIAVFVIYCIYDYIHAELYGRGGGWFDAYGFIFIFFVGLGALIGYIVQKAKK